MIDERNVIVVIPAYNPDSKLIDLVKQLNTNTSYQIIVINDGSDKKYENIFNKINKYCIILGYSVNHGKGYALKTGFKYIKDNYLEEMIIVTADADGQHTLQDIKSVANMAKLFEDKLILGSREFTGKIPLKSKLGNIITRKVFNAINHVKINDTQTGLRAFRSKYLTFMLEVKGDRYEYEIDMLIDWARNNNLFYEQLITTTYIDNNASSHFNPIKDSFKIYFEIFKFTGSSLISFVADYFTYIFMLFMTSNLQIGISILISNIFARLLSATLNYNLNRRFVFKNKNSNVSKTLWGYAKLAVTILILNTFMVEFFVNILGIDSYFAKIMVESILFVMSITVQKKYIFNDKEKKRKVNIQNEII